MLQVIELPLDFFPSQSLALCLRVLAPRFAFSFAGSVLHGYLCSRFSLSPHGLEPTVQLPANVFQASRFLFTLPSLLEHALTIGKCTA